MSIEGREMWRCPECGLGDVEPFTCEGGVEHIGCEAHRPRKALREVVVPDTPEPSSEGESRGLRFTQAERLTALRAALEIYGDRKLQGDPAFNATAVSSMVDAALDAVSAEQREAPLSSPVPASEDESGPSGAAEGSSVERAALDAAIAALRAEHDSLGDHYRPGWSKAIKFLAEQREVSVQPDEEER